MLCSLPNVLYLHQFILYFNLFSMLIISFPSPEILQISTHHSTHSSLSNLNLSPPLFQYKIKINKNYLLSCYFDNFSNVHKKTELKLELNLR